MTDTTTTWGEVQGRTITFPMEVAELRAATVLYSVPAAAATALLPGDAFEVVEVAPGTAQLVIAACDYVAQPVGRLRRAQPRLPRPARRRPGRGDRLLRVPDAGEPGLHLRGRQPGDGLPEDRRRPHRRVLRRHRDVPAGDGRPPRPHPHGAPRRAQRASRARSTATSYSYLDGVPYGTDLSMDMGTGLVDPADVQLELGDSPVADELRSLGLPCAPDFATWGEGLSATFLLGQPSDLRAATTPSRRPRPGRRREARRPRDLPAVPLRVGDVARAATPGPSTTWPTLRAPAAHMAATTSSTSSRASTLSAKVCPPQPCLVSGSPGAASCARSSMPYRASSTPPSR